LIAVAAKPYETRSLTAHGDWFGQVYAVPPLSQPDLALESEMTWFCELQVRTGPLTLALPDQAQDGLQQSQYLRARQLRLLA
jgi:hypothetical protein